MTLARSDAARGTADDPSRDPVNDPWFNNTRCGCEILLTYRDGSTRKAIRARGWSDWIRQRIMLTEQNVVSVELVRKLPREEYLRIRAAHKGQKKLAMEIQPPPSDRVSAHAWEILVRQHGRPRVVKVVCATESGSIDLARNLDGVDAAVAVRPMTVEEYRESLVELR